MLVQHLSAAGPGEGALVACRCPLALLPVREAGVQGSMRTCLPALVQHLTPPNHRSTRRYSPLPPFWPKVRSLTPLARPATSTGIGLVSARVLLAPQHLTPPAVVIAQDIARADEDALDATGEPGHVDRDQCCWPCAAVAKRAARVVPST